MYTDVYAYIYACKGLLALSNKNINGLIFHFIEVDHPPKKINRWKLNI